MRIIKRALGRQNLRFSG